jgi:hypothetical protein
MRPLKLPIGNTGILLGNGSRHEAIGRTKIKKIVHNIFSRVYSVNSEGQKRAKFYSD